MNLGTITIQGEDWNDDLGRFAHSRVLEADPLALISKELLDSIRNDDLKVTPFRLDGDRLTVEDSHGTRLIYRVHSEPFHPGWPDGGYLIEQMAE